MENQFQKSIANITAPQAGSKQAKLVGLLSRKNTVTLAKANVSLGWQKHTTSAALTGLRKRSYTEKRQIREGKNILYTIRTDVPHPETSAC